MKRCRCPGLRLLARQTVPYHPFLPEAMRRFRYYTCPLCDRQHRILGAPSKDGQPCTKCGATGHDDNWSWSEGRIRFKRQCAQCHHKFNRAAYLKRVPAAKTLDCKRCGNLATSGLWLLRPKHASRIVPKRACRVCWLRGVFVGHVLISTDMYLEKLALKAGGGVAAPVCPTTAS